jgi:hypothetical protein
LNDSLADDLFVQENGLNFKNNFTDFSLDSQRLIKLVLKQAINVKKIDPSFLI